MRVRPPQAGKRRTLDEEETYPRPDRPLAAPGGRRTGHRSLGPRGRQEARDQRGDLPPLEKPLWRDEGRCDEALEGVGVRERLPEEDRRRAGGGRRHPKGGEPGKRLSPTRRRISVARSKIQGSQRS